MRRRIVILFVGSIVAIPLVTGLVSGSLLLAVVVGTVWMSLSTVILGIWASHRNMGHLAAGHASTTSSLPNGWMLPTDVVVRNDVSEAAARAIDRRRILAASLAVVLSCLSMVVLMAWGHIAKHTASGQLVTPVGLTILVDLLILWFCLRSVHGGIPRPSLDRPSFAALAVTAGGPLFILVLTTVVGFRGFIWVQADGISLTLLWLAFGANVWWAIEMTRRWNLSYEVKKF